MITAASDVQIDGVNGAIRWSDMILVNILCILLPAVGCPIDVFPRISLIPRTQDWKIEADRSDLNIVLSSLPFSSVLSSESKFSYSLSRSFFKPYFSSPITFSFRFGVLVIILPNPHRRYPSRLTELNFSCSQAVLPTHEAILAGGGLQPPSSCTVPPCLCNGLLVPAL